MISEQERLQQSLYHFVDWKRWGPYVSDRQWGTVREDYSPHGTAWTYFPFDQARSKAYRWGEDGLAGICDRQQHLCFALALWNGRDPILKERLFGLSGPEGNHGEDVKEYYYFLDNTPTHSYMKYLYKYPQQEYPYSHLREENERRNRSQPEYELIDTGIFDENRYFDIFVEYAKAGSEDILVRLKVINHGPAEATLDLLPTLWFRNTWSWQFNAPRPALSHDEHSVSALTYTIIKAEHPQAGMYWLSCEGTPPLLFTENETNTQLLYGSPNATPYVKDGINDYLVHGKHDAVNPAQKGTKVSAHYHLTLGAGETKTIQLHLSNETPENLLPFNDRFAQIFEQRMQEADDFYRAVIPAGLSQDATNVARQAFAGMLWNKQFYSYDVNRWLKGDPTEPPPPPERLSGRNHTWTHLHNFDVISMPDTWEYPWYAAWDLAFHCVVFCLVDPEFAKEQLLMLEHDWFMHSRGQLPACEWDFSDANPPIHAWAAYRIYTLEEQRSGKGDRDFLEKVFHRLLINFTWWVNVKDYDEQNVFEGGFLGLDNIGVFDRDATLPDGSHLEQSDGTCWMAMYCLNMLTIALELAQENPNYGDIASKFFDHFMYIAHTMNHAGVKGLSLWNEEDGFYYSVLHIRNDNQTYLPLKVRSMVGLIALLAVATPKPELLDLLPDFKQRLQRFIENWPDAEAYMERRKELGQEKLLLALVNHQKLPRILQYMLDESEFLSSYGLRSLSRYYLDHPYTLKMDGISHRVDYEPAESTTDMFGGNSNWRGPVWFPVNYLMIESLQRLHSFYGETFKVEFPTGSGNLLSLGEVAAELSRRLVHIFLQDEQGCRAVFGGVEKFQRDPHWCDFLWFYEYFNGDNGAGLGASHQTGWTGLVAYLLQESGERKRQN